MDLFFFSKSVLFIVNEFVLIEVLEDSVTTFSFLSSKSIELGDNYKEEIRNLFLKIVVFVRYFTRQEIFHCHKRNGKDKLISGPVQEHSFIAILPELRQRHKTFKYQEFFECFLCRI